MPTESTVECVDGSTPWFVTIPDSFYYTVNVSVVQTFVVLRYLDSDICRSEVLKLPHLSGLEAQ